MHEKVMSAAEALASRRAIRAFLKKDVPVSTVRQILQQASQAPSSGNIQPWQVIVLTGKALQTLAQELSEKYLRGESDTAEYSCYPSPWSEPYLARRRKLGHDLYTSLHIERGDKEKMAQQQAQNFRFFDAPVGLLFTMDRSMGKGNWVDLGIFMQSIMLAARSFGLDTCPQASFSDYHESICRRLAIPSDRQLINGMALGYRDSTAAENLFKTEREAVDNFTRFVSELD